MPRSQLSRKAAYICGEKGRDCRGTQRWCCRDRNQGSGKKRGKQRSVHSTSRLRDNNEEGGDGSMSTRTKQVARWVHPLTGPLCDEVYWLTVYYLPAAPRPLSISELQKKPCKHLSKTPLYGSDPAWDRLLCSGTHTSIAYRHPKPTFYSPTAILPPDRLLGTFHTVSGSNQHSISLKRLRNGTACLPVPNLEMNTR